VARLVSAAIVDYGLGNLFSIRQACEAAGMEARITASHAELLDADVILLPGVGAFGDAMAALRRLDLVGPLRAVGSSGKLIVGICLGMQLLLTESREFGRHEGLGLVEGEVVSLREQRTAERRLKVPLIGWHGIYPAPGRSVDDWAGTPLDGTPEGASMYFVHSFHVTPADGRTVLATSTYGDLEFCSALRSGNVMGFQFHPERSGPEGLRIYGNIAKIAAKRYVLNG
jgi:imidazole glycerol-phosphate synthase subunit HisH